MNKIQLSITATMFALATSTTQAVDGETYEIDLSGWQTWGGIGSPNNTTLALDLSATWGNEFFVTGVGWDLTIASIGPSWQSEVAFDIDGGVVVTPGTGTTGTGSYSSGGIINLVDANIADVLIEDGIVNIEVFETFDDPNNTDTGLVQDANISGTLYIQAGSYVPGPGAMPLLAAPMLLTRRRRR